MAAADARAATLKRRSVALAARRNYSGGCLRDKPVVALLILFTLAGLALNVHWLVQDERPTAYDDSWYLENAFNLYHRLTQDGPAAFVSAYLETFRIKAPLIAVLPLPFFLAFGPSLDAALLVNCVFLVVINVYLFRLGRRWFSPATGLLAVVIFQTMPVTIGMSRAFMTEYGLAAFVIAFVYYLVESDHFSNRAAALKLGIVGGLGLLMKFHFLIVVIPLLVVLVRAWREDRFASARGPLRLAAVAVAVTAGPWYFPNVSHVVVFSWGVIGHLANYQLSSQLQWLDLASRMTVSSYYGWALALLGLALFLSSARPKVQPPSERSLLLCSWFLPGAASALLGAHQDYRLVLGLLPAVAIGLAEAAWRLVRSRLRPAIAGGLLVLALAQPILAWAALSDPAAWLTSFRRSAGWARLPDNHGAWGQDSIIRGARRLTLARTGNRNVVVGVEHAYFNSTLFNCLNRRDDGPLQFHTLAFEPDIPAALARVRDLKADVVIIPEGLAANELEAFLNHPNQALRDALEQGELPYRRAATIPLRRKGLYAVLYHLSPD